MTPEQIAEQAQRESHLDELARRRRHLVREIREALADAEFDLEPPN